MRIHLLATLLVSVVCLSRTFAQSASITSGCAPLTVDFSAPAGQATFFWDFGNGANSTDAAPSTTFAEAGTYTVELRTSAGGDLVGSLTITVFTPPVVSLTVDTTRGCIPLDLQFTSTSTAPAGVNITGYNWVFGDGGSGSSAAPNHTYNTPGMYDVSLQVLTDQAGCNVTEIFPALVTVGGVQGVNFFTNPNPALVCDPPLTVGFINSTNPTGLTFDWNFGNGNTFTGIAPPNELYTEAGDYTVTLTASDSLGCTGERTRPVSILSPISCLNVPDTVCGEELVFYEPFALADEIVWEFPASSLQGIDELGRRWVIFTEPGINEVGLQLTNNTPITCVLDTTLLIWADTVNMELAADPTFTCENILTTDFSATSSSGAGFEWLSQNGDSIIGPMATFTYEHIDTLEFQMNNLTPFLTQLVATNPSGCRDTILHIDTIFTPNALFMPDVVSGCAPLTVDFEDYSASFSDILSYQYNYGDGNTAVFANDDNHSYTFTEPGEYEVVLDIVNANDCRDTSYVRLIEVGAPADIEFVY
ncbi:MAG: PKD domain-containing protein, partial [Bacteroidota bacterium]